MIGGFAILQASSREDAVEQARKFLEVMRTGECEIRQLFDASPGDAAAHHAELREQFAGS